MTLRDEERIKYENVWGNYPKYRVQADGDPVVDLAYTLMGCEAGESLIDWGCGRGTPAAKFQEKGLKVTGVDIAHNCLNEGVDIPLRVGCLWEPFDPPLEADYSFSTDVLEHIPKRHLVRSLKNIFFATRQAAFLQVCTQHDTFGRKHMDPPQVLHLSVMLPGRWRNVIRRVGWTIRNEGSPDASRWWALCVK
jgi:hypothetical protein